jgi:hypothetical protein
VLLGLAKLAAAAAMWEGQEWGGYLLAGTVALLLPFDLRQAVVDPTWSHVLLTMANATALVVLVLLVRGWPPVGHSSPDSTADRRCALGSASDDRPPLAAWPQDGFSDACPALRVPLLDQQCSRMSGGSQGSRED